MDKKSSRIRRSQRTRARIRLLGVPRLSIHRTPRHIYAQVITSSGSVVVASASTLDTEVRGVIADADKTGAAAVVGKMIASRAQAVGVKKVAFDRSGFKYHGRVKALADAARENGLEF